MRRLIWKTRVVWEREEGFSVLLVLLVATIFAGPLLREWFPGLLRATGAFLIVLFVVGAFMVARNTWSAIAVSLLAGAATALEIAHDMEGSSDALAPWRLAATGLTLAVFTGVTLARVFHPGPVTSHRLVGAIVAFLLVGLTWSYVYSGLELARPGSFHAAQATGESYSTLVYYSFVTLSTVGYGDVVPVTAAARALSNLEALVGVLYPAVLIGRLLSKERPSDATPDGPEDPPAAGPG